MNLSKILQAIQRSTPAQRKKALLIFFGATVLLLSFAIGYQLFEDRELPIMSASAQEALIRDFITAINAGDTDTARACIIEEVPYRIPANEFGERIAAEIKLSSIADPAFEGAPVREIELDTLDTSKIMSRAALEYLEIFGKRADDVSRSEEDEDLAKIYGALLKIEPLPRMNRIVLVSFEFTDVAGENEPALKIVYNSFVAEAFSGFLTETVERLLP